MSALEDEFAYHCKVLGLPEPVREFKFHSKRRWRADFAWPDRKIMVEIEGGTYSNGRHNRAAGFRADAEKYNEAARLGWAVYRFTGDHVKSGHAADYMEQIFLN